MKISTTILFMMQGAALGACGGVTSAPSQGSTETPGAPTNAPAPAETPPPADAPPPDAPPTDEDPPADPPNDAGDAGTHIGPSHEDGCPACGRG